MLAAMSRSFLPEVTWTQPAGGVFVWATLPAALDAADVLRDALRDKVAFVPASSSFFADGSGHNTMRLNFTNASVDLIAEGMARLGRTLTRRVKNGGDSRVGASLTKIRQRR
jgi:DNA-binding transcriptional MocR family regulator